MLRLLLFQAEEDCTFITFMKIAFQFAKHPVQKIASHLSVIGGYTIKLYSDAGIYPYTEFPEDSSVCFAGHEYTSAASYPYSAISILSDITFNCNVAVDRVTLVGYSLFDEEGARNVSYTKKFTISDNGIYLSNVDLQCLRALTAGDINKDDVLNAQDLLIMQYHILGISVLPDNLLSVSDVNSDGVIDSADLLIIQMLILYS